MTEQEAIEMMQGYQITDAVDRAEYDAFQMAIDALEEIQKYRDIGTLKECREARELQNPKRPNTWGDGCDDEGGIIYDMYDCPNCGTTYEIDYDEYDFCPDCGQKLDWSEEK